MTIIVVHGGTAAAQIHHAEAFAALYRLHYVAVDVNGEASAFPARNALILTDRSPAAIRNHREAAKQQLGEIDPLAFVPIAAALRCIGAAPVDKMPLPDPQPPRRLTRGEHVALACLLEGRAFTYRVAMACGYANAARSTALARTILRRLEKWGFVECLRFSGGNSHSWQITDAGRKAVQP